RRVRVLVEAVVLDLPHAVIAELIGELDLLDAVAEQLRLAGARRVGDLHLVEHGELHEVASLGRSQAGRRARKVETMPATMSAPSGWPSTRTLPVSCAAAKSVLPASRASRVSACMRTTEVGGRGSSPTR